MFEFPGVDWSTMHALGEGEILAERLAGWQERYPTYWCVAS